MHDDDIIHVPPESPSGPVRIAFVGEAPGEDEIARGRPLVGPSGRIFNALLRTAGLRREDYWIGNVFDQKLPGNDIASWLVTKAEAEAAGMDTSFPLYGRAGLLRPEYRWHLSRLASELAAVNPVLVVPLGATALWAFTGETDIGNFRGQPQMGTLAGRRYKLLPTFHPAHVMRQWKFFPVVVGDLIKAAREAEFPELRLPQKTLCIAPTLAEVREFEQLCLNAEGPVSVDIETGWGQITSIGFAPDASTAICIPFVDLSRPTKSFWASPAEELEVWRAVRRMLESPVPKLGQNFAGYDAYWLVERYGLKVMNLRHDTRLMHHALYPELPKDLAFMGASYGSQGSWKHMGRKTEKRDS